ncbi:MAG: ankyrin repeat domain-containing protein [Rickettsiaceae bacterium]|nr:ankyrin repeat domain-containing protein [Rickettsiaceae bacterium]
MRSSNNIGLHRQVESTRHLIKSIQQCDKPLAYYQILRHLKEGANVNATDGNGKTVLHIAVEYNAPKNVLELLLEYNADINAKDNNNKTPIDYAKANRHDTILQILNIPSQSDNLNYVDNHMSQDIINPLPDDQTDTESELVGNAGDTE